MHVDIKKKHWILWKMHEGKKNPNCIACMSMFGNAHQAESANWKIADMINRLSKNYTKTWSKGELDLEPNLFVRHNKVTINETVLPISALCQNRRYESSVWHWAIIGAQRPYHVNFPSNWFVGRCEDERPWTTKNCNIT